MTRVSLATLALTLSLASAFTLQARAESRPANSSLVDVVPYDLEGDRTLKALATLKEEAQDAKGRKKQHELAFVRMMALSDLWIIAHVRDDVTLRDQVAAALETEPAEVPAKLSAALRGLDGKVVHDIVRDAQTALAWTAALPLAQPGNKSSLEAVTLAPVGPRTQVLYLMRVLAGTRAVSKRAVIEELAELAVDPCANKAPCATVYAQFDPTGRRAVHALSTALSTAALLQKQAKDPFVAALEQKIASEHKALATVELAPNVQLEGGLSRAHQTSGGEARTPEVVVLVTSERVELGFVPRVRVTATGQLELAARGEPVLPNVREVKLGSSFSPSVRSIEELVSALLPMQQALPDAEVAVAAAPNTPSHIWARALLSAQAAGFKHVAMLGMASDGDMRLVDVEVIGPMHAADVGPRELNVLVRLGGFTVKRAGPTVTIPRVKRDDGFAFDFDGLITSARPEQAKSTKLTFMSDVAADTLAATAFLVAPRNQALTVVLP